MVLSIQQAEIDLSSLPEVSEGSRLRVLIDARKLNDGGIGVYTENLITGLLAQSEIDITLLVNPAALESAERPRPWLGEVRLIAERARPYSVGEMLHMPARIPWHDFDIFHVPHFTLPYGCRIPTVITVHDLIHVHHPERRFYPLIAKPLIRSALRRATRVVTVSHATYRELLSFARDLPTLIKKLSVVPNALDPFYIDYARRALSTAGGCGGVQGRYLLAVLSTLKPHKGLVDLLEAFRRLKGDLAVDAGASAIADADREVVDFVRGLKLVLAGQGTENLGPGSELGALASSINGVQIAGAVSKEDLAHLYAGAVALVVPSTAEGFCLPVIEAQSLGTPVIARPVPAILELLSTNDTVAADFSRESFYDSIRTFLAGQARRTQCVALGANKLSRFSREEIARGIIEVYRDATRNMELV